MDVVRVTLLNGRTYEGVITKRGRLETRIKYVSGADSKFAGTAVPTAAIKSIEPVEES